MTEVDVKSILKIVLQQKIKKCMVLGLKPGTSAREFDALTNCGTHRLHDFSLFF